MPNLLIYLPQKTVNAVKKVSKKFDTTPEKYISVYLKTVFDAIAELEKQGLKVTLKPLKHLK